MKTLLCLISDQHVPNLLAVHHYQPERLVLVETQRMVSAGNHLLAALRLGGREFPVERLVRAPLASADDFAKARDDLTKLAESLPDAEWIVNLTGGTKIMALAAHEVFRSRRAKLIYTPESQPADLVDVATGHVETGKHALTIAEFVRGYGFEFHNAESITENEQRTHPWERSAILLAQHASDDSVVKGWDDRRKRLREKGDRLGPGDLNFPCPELSEIWLPGGQPREFSKYEGQFLTGGWLEVFFWHLLSRHADALGLRDVRLGVKVRRVGETTDNDLDVAFLHQHRLHVVECKTGAQEKDSDADALYKLEAILGQFGALRVKSYLATTASNIFDKQTGKLKSHIATRAEIHKCGLMTAATIRDLAAEPLSHEVVRAAFFPRR